MTLISKVLEYIARVDEGSYSLPASAIYKFNLQVEWAFDVVDYSARKYRLTRELQVA